MNFRTHHGLLGERGETASIPPLLACAMLAPPGVSRARQRHGNRFRRVFATGFVSLAGAGSAAMVVLVKAHWHIGIEVPLCFAGTHLRAHQNTYSHRIRTVRLATQDINDAVQGAVKGVQQGVENVANAPSRLKQEAEEKVAETIDGITRDDGRILDENSPAGAVGALAVSSAVLPYVPLSLYSSYLVITTGQGVEPGPNGIYGIAEGLGTLTILLVVLWSLTSFVTRARGLPEGPFGLLGATQALSWLAAAAFGASQVLGGGGTTAPPNIKMPDLGNIVKDIKMPAIDLKMPSTDFKMPAELPSANFEMPDLSGISKSLNAKMEDAKKQANDAMSEASSKASKITSIAQDGAKAVEGAKDVKEVVKKPGEAKEVKQAPPAQPPKKEKEAGGPKSFEELLD